jgi:hypothetical protein
MELGQVTDATKNESKLGFKKRNEMKDRIVIMLIGDSREGLTYFYNFYIFEKIKPTKCNDRYPMRSIQKLKNSRSES